MSKEGRRHWPTTLPYVRTYTYALNQNQDERPETSTYDHY